MLPWKYFSNFSDFSWIRSSSAGVWSRCLKEIVNFIINVPLMDFKFRTLINLGAWFYVMPLSSFIFFSSKMEQFPSSRGIWPQYDGRPRYLWYLKVQRFFDQRAAFSD